MENISSFLARFKKILSSHKASEYVFLEIIKDELGIELQKEDVKVRSGILCVTASPTIKNTLFLNKRKILQRLIN